MNMTQQLIIAAALVLSASFAIAETGNNGNFSEGFHALRQMPNQGTYAIAALTDEQLGNIVGGYLAPDQNPSDFPPWILPYVRTSQSYTFGGSSGGPWLLPNPEDPDRPWGPLGPVVKTWNAHLFEPTPEVNKGRLTIDTVPQPTKNW